MTPTTPQAMLADIRALFASLVDPAGGFAQNATVGTAVWNRGPGLAVATIAQLAARRVDKVRRARDLDEAPFPREQLLNAMQHRTPAAVAAVDLVETTSTTLLEAGPVNDFVAQHGLPGLMLLAQVANKTGEMLVEADPGYSSLSDLLVREALADELEAMDDDQP